MASYDHWLNDSGIAFANALHDKPQDIVGHGAFADYLEEHGDPLHAVVRRSPKFADWLKSQTGDPGRFPAGPTSHEGYIVRSHPDMGMGLGGSLGVDRAKAAREPYFYVHHRVVGRKGQPGGRHSVIAASINFPGATPGNVENRARFVAPVTKDELKAILQFHRGVGWSGRKAASRAIKSPAVGEHPGIGDGSLQLAAREEYDAKVAQAQAYRQKIIGKLAANPHNKELRGKLADFLDKLQGITGDKEHDAHLARLLRLHTTEVEMSHGTGQSSRAGDDLYNFRSFYKGSRGWLTDEEQDNIRRLLSSAAPKPSYGSANTAIMTGHMAGDLLDRLSQHVPPYHPAYMDLKEQAVKERESDRSGARPRTPVFVSESLMPWGHQYGSYVGGRAIAEMHPTPADAFLYSIRHMNQTGKTGLVVNMRLPHDQNRKSREEAMPKPEAPAQAARADAHPGITAEAREYHEAHRNTFGLDLPLDGPGPRFDPELSHRAAEAFERAKHLPNHPKVKEAYDALKREIVAQYNFLEGKGVKFEPHTSEAVQDIYPSSKEMIADVRTNRRLRYNATPPGTLGDDHPLSAPVPGHPDRTHNDLFRAVHDYFGHAMKGHQFGPKGELQAWGEHARMFSPKARLALTAETHGQNSWVNFGPHSDKPVTERPYAEQKATIMPKNVVPKMEPTKMARGDALLANTGSDEPDPDSITPAKVIPNRQAVVWKRGPSGHLVGLPLSDGTTLVRHFKTMEEAKPHVMQWAKTAAPVHQTALLTQLRSQNTILAPQKARVVAPARPDSPPVAERVQVARPTIRALLGRPGPTAVQYKPGMEPPVKADRSETQATPNHPELIRRVLAGNLDGAKKFLEDAGDPLTHLLDSRSRYSADSKANLCCGPNTVKTYGHATNHQATVRLLPGGEVEAVFRHIGAGGPRAVGFRKQLDPETVRAIVAYHRQPQAPRGAVAGEPEKMAGPQLQAANREPIRVKTVGGKAGVSLRLNEADPVKLTRRRQFQGWWLSPKGKMHRTGYTSHARYASAKFGKTTDEMHADGWHRVARFGGSRLHILKGGKGLNEDQRKAVKSHADRRELAVGREPEGADVQTARNPAGPSGLAQALKDLQSQRQMVRKQLAARIAQEAGIQLASLLDSASVVPHPRAGIVQQLQHNDRDTMNYAAAWYGMLAREPRLTIFHEGDGNDVLHVTNSPLGVSQILETAGQHRLPGVSVSPKGNIHVVDPGGQNTPGVMRFLQDVRAVRPNIIRGEAHRIGSASGDPSDSRAAYRDVIKNFQGS